MNPVTSRKAAANLFWITRGLFSTLRALRPLDMLVNVFFIGIAVALPTLRSCARYELFFFPLIKSCGMLRMRHRWVEQKMENKDAETDIKDNVETICHMPVDLFSIIAQWLLQYVKTKLRKPFFDLPQCLSQLS